MSDRSGVALMSYGKSSITGARQARTAIAIKLGVHANIKPRKIAATTLIDASLRRGGRAHPCCIGRSKHGPVQTVPSDARKRRRRNVAARRKPPHNLGRERKWPRALGIARAEVMGSIATLNVATDAYMGGIAGHVSHPVVPGNLRAITQGGPRGAVRPKASECEWVPLALPIGQRQDFFVACDLSHRAGPRDGPTVFSADLERWALMSRNMLAWISAERRLLGLNAGDWTILLAGFALVALLAFLL